MEHQVLSKLFTEYLKKQRKAKNCYTENEMRSRKEIIVEAMDAVHLGNLAIGEIAKLSN